MQYNNIDGDDVLPLTKRHLEAAPDLIRYLE